MADEEAPEITGPGTAILEWDRPLTPGDLEAALRPVWPKVELARIGKVASGSARFASLAGEAKWKSVALVDPETLDHAELERTGASGGTHYGRLRVGDELDLAGEGGSSPEASAEALRRVVACLAPLGVVLTDFEAG